MATIGLIDIAMRAKTSQLKKDLSSVGPVLDRYGKTWASDIGGGSSRIAQGWGELTDATKPLSAGFKSLGAGGLQASKGIAKLSVLGAGRTLQLLGKGAVGAGSGVKRLHGGLSKLVGG